MARVVKHVREGYLTYSHRAAKDNDLYGHAVMNEVCEIRGGLKKGRTRGSSIVYTICACMSRLIKAVLVGQARSSYFHLVTRAIINSILDYSRQVQCVLRKRGSRTSRLQHPLHYLISYTHVSLYLTHL